jgi:hypothetical protein
MPVELDVRDAKAELSPGVFCEVTPAGPVFLPAGWRILHGTVVWCGIRSKEIVQRASLSAAVFRERLVSKAAQQAYPRPAPQGLQFLSDKERKAAELEN